MRARSCPGRPEEPRQYPRGAYQNLLSGRSPRITNRLLCFVTAAIRQRRCGFERRHERLSGGARDSYTQPMEILLPLGIVALVIWFVAKGLRAMSSPPSVSSQRATSRSTSPTPTRGTAVKGSRSMSADDCWVPPGGDATVAGYTIQGGMLYMGQRLSSIAGQSFEPALIDPSLRVNRSSPDHIGAGMMYWPSYSSISPECRAAYLDWLATGRRDPTACIGYVFLYFYGLERRALAEAPKSERAKQDLPHIMGEVEQLVQVYGGSRSFRVYATQLLDVLRILAATGDDIEPPTQRTGYELPVSLRVGVGRIVANGKPLPSDWALSWFLTHPAISLRTSVLRCSSEFNDLFRIRYSREFGEGLRLKPNSTRLKMSIAPASASFGGHVELSMDLPDVAALTSPIAKLRQIGESCATDLDAFSRWVGRNVDAPKTIAAVALLPPELATTHDSQEARELWRWIKNTLGAQERAVCESNDLLRHCASFGAGKLAKSEAVLLAQLLEKGGYGIEPDVRFGGAPLTLGGTAIVFKLPSGAGAIASPQYSAATVLLHLAVAVSAADGSISPSEEQHLQQHLQQALALSDAERLRLSAHLSWLLQSPPSLTALKKRLDPLDQSQRSAIASFMIGVAGADGEISPAEIRTVGKVYPMLGLDAEQVYSDVHAMTAGGATTVQATGPVTIIPGLAQEGYAIPSRPVPTQNVRLDMTAVNAKLVESAQISAILDDIFTDEEVVTSPTPSALAATGAKLSLAHGVLLSRLVERSEWSRVEFETIAAECRLLPDGAIDTLNEAAFEHSGAPVLEGDDPMQVDAPIAKELLT